jgi:hypothetical protein
VTGRQDNGELRVHNFARRLDPRSELTDDRGPVWAAKDIFDFEFDRLGQQADLAKEIFGGLPPGLFCVDHRWLSPTVV